MARRSPAQREHDLAETAELRLQGWYQHEIAEKLGVSRTQIIYDLKQVEKRWRERSVEAFETMKQRELRKLDHAERELWGQWRESIGTKTRTTSKYGADGKLLEKNTVEWSESGHAPYMVAIVKIIEQRCKILGLYVEAKTGPGAGDDRNPYEQLTESERDSALVALFNAVSEKVGRADPAGEAEAPPQRH